MVWNKCEIVEETVIFNKKLNTIHIFRKKVVDSGPKNGLVNSKIVCSLGQNWESFLGKPHFFGPLSIFFVIDVCFQTQKSSNKWSISIAYPLSTRCFSPESIPGVSIIVTHFNTGLLNVEPWNRFKKAPPNLDKGRNCFLLSTAKAFPGITCKNFTHEF